MSNDHGKNRVVEQTTTLNAFSQAIQREAHVLQDRPDILWQQIHNRLQWEDEPVIGLVTAGREQRSAPGEKPWIRTRTPLWESKALLLTLISHSGTVLGCAFSPDGSLIVSASWDKTLKVWDEVRGKEIFFIPLLGSLHSVGLHPWEAYASSGDAGGNMYMLYLHGIDYGPIVATAIKSSQGLVVGCLACQHRFHISRDDMGDEIACTECSMALRVNPFLVRSVDTSDRLREQEKREFQTAQEVKLKTEARVDDLFRKGGQLFNSRDFEGALNCFEAVLKQQPENSEAWLMHLSTLLRLDRRQETVQAADQVLENKLVSGELLASVYSLKGSALVGLGQYEQGLDSLDRALKLDENNAAIWTVRGNALSETGDYQQALESFLKVHKVDRSDETEAIIGMCYIHLEDFENANATFQLLIDSGCTYLWCFMAMDYS